MDIVAALHGSRLDNRQIVGRILPVAHDGHALRLKSLMDEVEPTLVIGFGLDVDAHGIKLETVAVNKADFDMPDNNGAWLRNVRLEPTGPACRAATYPIDDICAALSTAGIKAGPSSDAGRHLCNATLFHLLGLCASKPHQPICGFVHVPFSLEQLALSPTPPSGAMRRAMSLEAMIDAARIVLRQCAQVTQLPVSHIPAIRSRDRLAAAVGFG